MEPPSRKRAENPARLIEAAIEHVEEAVLITTTELDHPDPEIVYVNEGFCRMTGYAAEEVVGKTPRILQGPKTDRAELDRLRRCLARGQPSALRRGDNQLPQGRLGVRARVVHRAAA